MQDGEVQKQLKPKSFGKVATGGISFEVPNTGSKGRGSNGDDGKRKGKSGTTKKK